MAKFHLLLEGEALLSSPPSPPIALGSGDLVVLPRGAAHTLADNDTTVAVPLDDLLAARPLDDGGWLNYGGSGPLTRLLCGGFTLAEALPKSSLAAFPDVLVLRRDQSGAGAWLEPVLEALTDEAERGLPGGHAIVARLADVLLAQALRAWMIESGDADASAPRSSPTGRSAAHWRRSTTGPRRRGRSTGWPHTSVCHEPHSPRSSRQPSDSRRCGI